MKRLLLGTVLSSALLLAACGERPEEPKEEVEVTNEDKTEIEKQHEQKPEEEVEEELPEGISDLNVSDVRNDDTGKFKKVVTSNDTNMPENAVAYYNEYMEDGEIHYIIDFSKNTTTAINNMSGQLFVTVTEYVDKEEHDADKIGSGMVLADYIVSIKDGTIEEL